MQCLLTSLHLFILFLLYPGLFALPRRAFFATNTPPFSFLPSPILFSLTPSPITSAVIHSSPLSTLSPYDHNAKPLAASLTSQGVQGSLQPSATPQISATFVEDTLAAYGHPGQRHKRKTGVNDGKSKPDTNEEVASENAKSRIRYNNSEGGLESGEGGERERKRDRDRDRDRQGGRRSKGGKGGDGGFGFFDSFKASAFASVHVTDGAYLIPAKEALHNADTQTVFSNTLLKTVQPSGLPLPIATNTPRTSANPKIDSFAGSNTPVPSKRRTDECHNRLSQQPCKIPQETENFQSAIGENIDNTDNRSRGRKRNAKKYRRGLTEDNVEKKGENIRDKKRKQGRHENRRNGNVSGGDLGGMKKRGRGRGRGKGKGKKGGRNGKNSSPFGMSIFGPGGNGGNGGTFGQGGNGGILGQGGRGGDGFAVGNSGTGLAPVAVHPSHAASVGVGDGPQNVMVPSRSAAVDRDVLSFVTPIVEASASPVASLSLSVEKKRLLKSRAFPAQTESTEVTRSQTAQTGSVSPPVFPPSMEDGASGDGAPADEAPADEAPLPSAFASVNPNSVVPFVSVFATPSNEPKLGLGKGKEGMELPRTSEATIEATESAVESVRASEQEWGGLDLGFLYTEEARASQKVTENELEDVGVPESTEEEEIEDENEVGCFPGSAKVEVMGKVTEMRDLKVGDKVHVRDGKGCEVVLFTHRKTGKRKYIRIATAMGHVIRLSAGHLMYGGEERKEGEYGLVAAADVQIGWKVVTGNGSQVAVTEVDKVVEEGLYNPHTACGDIEVDGLSVSCYTEVIAVGAAHALLMPYRVAFQWLGLSWHGFADGVVGTSVAKYASRLLRGSTRRSV